MREHGRERSTILPQRQFRQDENVRGRPAYLIELCGVAAASSLCGKSGFGSNQENSNNPARKPPICACQATVAAAGYRKRPQPEQDIDAEPDREKKHTRASAAHCAAGSPARGRRCSSARPQQCKWSATLKRQNASPPPSCRKLPPTRRSSGIVRRHASPDARRRPRPRSRARKARKRPCRTARDRAAEGRRPDRS